MVMFSFGLISENFFCEAVSGVNLNRSYIAGVRETWKVVGPLPTIVLF